MLKILFGFFLTGIVGNYLLSRWKRKDWIFQRQLSWQEKEYLDLKQLVEEICTLIGSRVHSLLRYSAILHSNDKDFIEKRIAENDSTTKLWNERIHSFYVRMPLLMQGNKAVDIEKDLQPIFVAISNEIKKLHTQKAAGRKLNSHELSSIQRKIDSLQGKAIETNKEFLHYLISKRNTIKGEKIEYKIENLQKLSTPQLICSLFTRKIDSLSIMRTPKDF